MAKAADILQLCDNYIRAYQRKLQAEERHQKASLDVARLNDAVGKAEGDRVVAQAALTAAEAQLGALLRGF